MPSSEFFDTLLISLCRSADSSVQQVEAANQARHTNGNSMKQEDTTATLLRMGFPPQAVGPSALLT